MEAPPTPERLSPSHYLLFIWCLRERWYCSDRRQVFGWEACSLQDGREGGTRSQGHCWVTSGPPGQAGAAEPMRCASLRVPTRLGDVSFVTLQQDCSGGPKSLFSISVTVVLRLLEEPRSGRL